MALKRSGSFGPWGFMTDPASPSQVFSSQTTMSQSAASGATEEAPTDDYEFIFNHAKHNPITISCVHCSTIVGDSSSWFCSVKQISGITFDQLVDVNMGEEDKIVERGSFDALSTFRDILCGGIKCGRVIGKQYLATPKTLAHIQDKLTLNLDNIRIYEHSSCGPSIGAAESQEIYDLLHPKPAEMAEAINHVKYTVVVLAENQQRLQEEVRDVKLMSDEHESLRTKLNNLDALVQSVVETQNKLVQELRNIARPNSSNNNDNSNDGSSNGDTLQLIPNGSLHYQMKQHSSSPVKGKDIWSDFAPKDRQDTLEASEKQDELEKATEKRVGRKGVHKHNAQNKRKPTSPLLAAREPPSKRAAMDGEEDDEEVVGEVTETEQASLLSPRGPFAKTMP